MQTDKLFYEFFQLAPHTLFELLQIEPGCEYRFESPSVKATERRLDGFLEPLDPREPRYFLEVQGYIDPTIYWRTLHELSLYHEQRPALNGSKSYAVVLFLSAKFDPTIATLGNLQHGHKHWLLRGIIPDLVSQVKQRSPALNVLLPLAIDNEIVLKQEGENWVSSIRQAPDLDRATQERLIKLLTQFVVQKFSYLSRKEIEKMLHLTPFEETVAGREYIQEGLEQGMEQGLEKGLRQGLRQGLQQGLQQGTLSGKASLLSQQVSMKFGVAQHEVRQLLEPLTEPQLDTLSLYILDAEQYTQLQEWVARL